MKASTFLGTHVVNFAKSEIRGPKSERSPKAEEPDLLPASHRKFGDCPQRIQISEFGFLSAFGFGTVLRKYLTPAKTVVN